MAAGTPHARPPAAPWAGLGLAYCLFLLLVIG
jgi:hypothetical protein